MSASCCWKGLMPWVCITCWGASATHHAVLVEPLSAMSVMGGFFVLPFARKGMSVCGLEAVICANLLFSAGTDGFLTVFLLICRNIVGNFLSLHPVFSFV